MKKTKNLTAICFCLLLSAIAFQACTGAAPATDNEVSALAGEAGNEYEAEFKDIEGKEWLLSEIKSKEKTVTLDRNKYEASNMGAFFTIIFQEDKIQEGRVSGTGAPNRYFGSFRTSSDKKLNIGTLASTLMAAFIEPDEIKENEYFNYLSKVSRWDLSAGKLELYSLNNELEVVLVFIR